MSGDDHDDQVTAPARGVAGASGPLVGQAWARYQLREQLGEGGMGVVFAAFDPELDREVALKVLHDDQLARAGQERLRREARALARVTHPNVVPVYDVGEHAGRLYYTMERVRGRSLRQWAGEPRPWREVQRLFLDAAHGLAAIHAAGLVHRDIKPGNLLLGDDGRARVVDLGIAAGTAGPGGSTVVDTTTLRGAGTPAYMAPEQLDGDLGDAASDQFSLGVALDELLHGRPPFAGDTVAARRAAIAAGPAAPVRPVPEWLDRVARRAMAEAPADRFPDVATMAVALAGPRPRRWPFAVAAVIAIGGAAAVAFALAGRGAAPRCDLFDRELVGIWDDAARARVGAGFAASGLSYAPRTAAVLTERLDAYAAAWVAARQSACQAAASPTRERRELCLDRRRDQLRRVAGILGSGDAKLVDRGTQTLGALEPVSDCADATYLTAVAGDQSQVARDLLTRARVAQFAGDADAALSDAIEARAAATHAGDRATIAESLLVTALVRRERGELAGAIDDLRAAIDATDSGRTRVDAWIALGATLQMADRHDEAIEVLDRADAALTAEPDAARRIDLLTARGTLLSRRSDYAGALVVFEQVQTLAVDHYGADSPQLAIPHTNLAAVMRRLGRHDDAIRHSRRALDLLRVFGDEHPRVLHARRGLALAQGGAGMKAAAAEELAALLAIQLRRLGPDHVDVATARVSLGVELHGLARNEESLVLFRDALAVQERAAPDSQGTLNTRSNLAEILAVMGRHAEAEPLHRAVLATRIRVLGPTHLDVGISRWNLGRTLAELGRIGDARAELIQARAIMASRVGEDSADVRRVDAKLATLLLR